MYKPAFIALALAFGCLPATAAPSAAGLAACDVMTKSDVETVLRTNVNVGRPFTLGSPQQPVAGCAYLSSASDASATIEIGRADRPRFDSEERRYQPGGDHATQGPPRPVSGVGQQAFWFKGHLSNQLDVYAKGYLIGVNSTGGLDQLKALAKRALARL
jgi:hypothetical protein